MSESTKAAEGVKDVLTLDDKEYQARIASILDRGYSHDALNIDLAGTGLVGEWVLNDNQQITRMQTLGYKIDTEHAPKNPVHSHGDSKTVYGDVVFMTISERHKRIIDASRAELARRRLGDKVEDKITNSEEDRTFKGQMKSLEDVGITAIDAPSKADVVSGEQIKAALSEGQS